MMRASLQVATADGRLQTHLGSAQTVHAVSVDAVPLPPSFPSSLGAARRGSAGDVESMALGYQPANNEVVLPVRDVNEPAIQCLLALAS